MKRALAKRKLEELRSVNQCSDETGKTSPSLDTVLKVLASLGKTLAVVPLEQSRSKRKSERITMETTQNLPVAYQALWNSADVLRSKMDANDYKSYLLGMIFLRYPR